MWMGSLGSCISQVVRVRDGWSDEWTGLTARGQRWRKGKILHIDNTIEKISQWPCCFMRNVYLIKTCFTIDCLQTYVFLWDSFVKGNLLLSKCTLGIGCSLLHKHFAIYIKRALFLNVRTWWNFSDVSHYGWLSSSCMADIGFRNSVYIQEKLSGQDILM